MDIWIIFADVKATSGMLLTVPILKLVMEPISIVDF